MQITLPDLTSPYTTLYYLAFYIPLWPLVSSKVVPEPVSAPAPPPEPASAPMPAAAPAPMMAAPMRPATVPLDAWDVSESYPQGTAADDLKLERRGSSLSACAQEPIGEVFNWTHRNHADKIAEQDRKAREARTASR